MSDAVSDFLNLPDRRAVWSVAYTGAGATPGHDEMNAIRAIARERNVSAWDLKTMITETCLAMHDAECGCKWQRTDH